MSTKARMNTSATAHSAPALARWGDVVCPSTDVFVQSPPCRGCTARMHACVHIDLLLRRHAHVKWGDVLELYYSGFVIDPDTLEVTQALSSSISDDGNEDTETEAEPLMMQACSLLGALSSRLLSQLPPGCRIARRRLLREACQ